MWKSHGSAGPGGRKTRKKEKWQNISGLQGEMLSTSRHSSPWGSGSIPSSLSERCFLIIILTSTIYGPNAKHMHHIIYSLQQPYETGAIFVSILQIRDGAERGQWAELGLVLGTCQTVKPRSLILPFAALPKILSPCEIIYTYF